MDEELIKILTKCVRETVADSYFEEGDLIFTIVRSDLNHQVYLLSVFLYHYYGVPSKQHAVDYAFSIFVSFHRSIQAYFNNDSQKGENDENSYLLYLDSGLRFSNEFEDEEFEFFKNECTRRRSLRWKIA